MIGAVINGISSLIGNSISKSSQDATNESNYYLNRMNNEFNAIEADKAFRRETLYNDRIRAEDREYNSAKQVVERYRQAGLNPAMMMQGQSAGMASSNGVSSSVASAAPSAPQQAFRPDLGMFGSAIEGAMSRLLEKDLIKEQVNGIRIENQFKAQKLMAEILNHYADVRTKDARAKLDRTIEGLQHNIFNMQKDEAESRILVNREQAKIIATENLLKTQELDTFAQKFGEESAIRLAQKALYIAEGALTKEKAIESVKHAILLEAQYTGQTISNHQLQGMTDAIVEKAKSEAIRSRQPQNIWQGLSDSYSGFNKFMDDFFVKPSKRLWKDTRRSFGL